MTDVPVMPVDQLHAALAKAQAEMPNATLNKENPHFKSRYADLASIRDATVKALSKHGLSLNHRTEIIDDGSMLLIATLCHGASGQQEHAYWSITSTSPQGRMSELTYGRRGTWAMLTGITADDDDDAEGAERGTAAPKLTKLQSRTVHAALVREARSFTDKDALTKWAFENAYRSQCMHDEIREDWIKTYKSILGAFTGASEVREDSEFKQRLRESVAQDIDDEIPDERGGDDAA